MSSKHRRCCCCDESSEESEAPVPVMALPPKPEKPHYEALLGLFAVIVMAAVGIVMGGVQ